MTRSSYGLRMSLASMVDADFDSVDCDLEAMLARCRSGFAISADDPTAAASGNSGRIPSDYLAPTKTSGRRRA